MGTCLQQTGRDLQVVIQLHTAAQAAGQVAIAVVVGLITTGARLLGFESMTGLAARRQTVPGRPRRAAHPATGRARRLAAIAKTEEWPRLLAIGLTRENLDDPANGFRAIQAGTRPAHHLDTLDQLQRQVLPGQTTTAHRAGFYAIDEHQHMVAGRAAHE